LDEWRRLHDEELHNFYTSPDIIKVIKWESCSTHERNEKCIQNFGRKTWREEKIRKILVPTEG